MRYKEDGSAQRAEQAGVVGRSSVCGCGGDSVPGPHLWPVGTIVRLKPPGAFRREAPSRGVRVVPGLSCLSKRCNRAIRVRTGAATWRRYDAKATASS